MKTARRGARDFLVGAILAGGLVALVLGWFWVGLILTVFSLLQVLLIAAGRGPILIDQRASDREGKPNLKSR